MNLYIIPIKTVYHEDNEAVIMAESLEKAKEVALARGLKESMDKYGIEEHEGNVYYNGGCDC